ncbi:hypothetical protein QBC39DRAFT_380902 [Podospora conica]|nr:hypothetical protein QBC39DRAFT_380902 [Schizothecium conicum]
MPTTPIPPNTPPTLSLPPIDAPTLGPGGTFTVACSTRIAAPPRRCLDIVLHAPDYPKWNPFCRKCTITSPPHQTTLALSTKFTFDVHLPPFPPQGQSSGDGRPTHLEVSVLEAIDDPATGRRGWRVAWQTDGGAGGIPTWLLRTERTQEFIEVEVEGGGVETEYVCWETFYGPMARVVKLAVGGRVAGGFGGWMEGLRGVAEGVE